jgi:hypothetical protein
VNAALVLFRDAFMTQKALVKRGRPVRAPVGKLTTAAKFGVGVATLVELGCVLTAGGAHGASGVVLAVVVYLLAHVAIYVIESRPASVKRRIPVQAPVFNGAPAVAARPPPPRARAASGAPGRRPCAGATSSPR